MSAIVKSTGSTNPTGSSNSEAKTLGGRMAITNLTRYRGDARSASKTEHEYRTTPLLPTASNMHKWRQSVQPETHAAEVGAGQCEGSRQSANPMQTFKSARLQRCAICTCTESISHWRTSQRGGQKCQGVLASSTFCLGSSNGRTDGTACAV